MGDYSAGQRRAMVKQGQAMPDPDGPGKFPIRTRADVENAVRLHGRVPASHQAADRRHIIRNAKRIGAMAAVPDHWNTDGSLSSTS